MKMRTQILFTILLPSLYVELLWWFNSQDFSILQAVGVLLISLSVQFLPGLLVNMPKGRKAFSEILAGLVPFFFGSLFFTFLDAWIGLFSYLAVLFSAVLLLLLCDLIMFRVSPFVRFIIATIFAALFGSLLIGTVQVLERFSEEEFFAILQVLLAAGWWFLSWITWRSQFSGEWYPRIFRKTPFAAIGIVAGVILLVGLGSVFLLQQYQASFFPDSVPQSSAVTDESPFYCGTSSKTTGPAYNGSSVLQDILTRVAANTVQYAPNLGFLAVQTEDDRWREAFRDTLLQEAEQQLYSGPSNSVKYGQYEVALRAYYFHEITNAYPDLFTEAEKQQVIDWFAAVNQRSLTVEWVDWMYSAAFGEWPEGPYLNQENGASLLAVLEDYDYAHPALRTQNAVFLNAHQFGWYNHFRNTDDSIGYQSIWINNALFQANYFGNAPQEPITKSFEWLLVQALPDGNIVGYNPDKVSLAGISYFGAQLTGDARLLWLAGRSAEYARLHDILLNTQPGIDGPLPYDAVAPDFGSCLIYGSAGTPVKFGPLSPDKIVFRSGWQTDSTYLNLNLRFTGWHRYKATNSIISIYREEPLIVEMLSEPAAHWLPVGRAKFRDKRIPRENLNGLLIPKAGISRITHWLTGVGSAWAQDPPFYATVNAFDPGAEVDQSETAIQWNGWHQVRKITFVHDGPIVIIDQATGPAFQKAAMTWQGIIPDPSQRLVDGRVLLGEGGKNAMVLVPLEEGELKDRFQIIGEQNGLQVLFEAGKQGSLQLATVILPGEWVNASVKKETLGCGDVLTIQNGEQLVHVPVNESPCSLTVR